MTTDELKGLLCKFFNDSPDFSIPFIKAPTDRPAPVGNYIAVRVETVSQHGSAMQPMGNEGFHFQNVASIAFIEVEGDGDNLRRVRNALQMASFIDYARSFGFSIWTIGQIIEIPSYDGKFYVKQWRLSAQVNFADEVSGNVPKIGSVDACFFADGSET